MNINQALTVVEKSKANELSKAIMIARTHVSCFGGYGLQGICGNYVELSRICKACKKHVTEIGKIKEDKHIGRKRSKSGKKGSNKKVKG